MGRGSEEGRRVSVDVRWEERRGEGGCGCEMGREMWGGKAMCVWDCYGECKG